MVSDADRRIAKSGRIKDLRTLINKMFKAGAEDASDYRELVIFACGVVHRCNGEKGKRFICDSGHAHRSIDAKRKCEKTKGEETREHTDRNDTIHRCVNIEGESVVTVAREHEISIARVSQISRKGLRISLNPDFPDGCNAPYKWNRHRKS